MKRWHVIKSTRLYYGHGYCGPASGFKPAEFRTKKEAEKAVKKFTKLNIVGWQVVDRKGGGYGNKTGEGTGEEAATE
jgi:hypothetical protein